ncbi:hypothetical protein JR316_0000772 [Psilocybe cubensis]|uniref:Uncharacterized protein n=1 Tax=Psilocybe cubensis TaxID=181762 RepID=A0ACB8HG79_PSICU|nr:hypothetical protein JR316_0000772 [Psilocybe cubensis]KAH9486707.1 hypothetical protein JR316_0000772 [Psilocybe cubensis]
MPWPHLPVLLLCAAVLQYQKKLPMSEKISTRGRKRAAPVLLLPAIHQTNATKMTKHIPNPQEQVAPVVSDALAPVVWNIEDLYTPITTGKTVVTDAVLALIPAWAQTYQAQVNRLMFLETPQECHERNPLVSAWSTFQSWNVVGVSAIARTADALAEHLARDAALIREKMRRRHISPCPSQRMKTPRLPNGL